MSQNSFTSYFHAMFSNLWREFRSMQPREHNGNIRNQDERFSMWWFWAVVKNSNQPMSTTVYLTHIRRQTIHNDSVSIVFTLKHLPHKLFFKDISTYINTKMSVCECVCLSVCLFAFFSAIWNPIGISFGTKLPYASEMVLIYCRFIALFPYFFKISL